MYICMYALHGSIQLGNYTHSHYLCLSTHLDWMSLLMLWREAILVPTLRQSWLLGWQIKLSRQWIRQVLFIGGIVHYTAWLQPTASSTWINSDIHIINDSDKYCQTHSYVITWIRLPVISRNKEGIYLCSSQMALIFVWIRTTEAVLSSYPLLISFMFR